MGREDGKGKEARDGRQTQGVYTAHENIFDKIGGILIHRLSHYAVFCEPKELKALAMQTHA
jgi:hypothetical protein